MHPRRTHPGWLRIATAWLRPKTGETWRTLRWELEKLRLGRFSGPAGEVHQRAETTSREAAIFKALAVAEPPRFLHLAPAARAAS